MGGAPTRQRAQRLPGERLRVLAEDRALDSTTPTELLARTPTEIRDFRCQQHQGRAPHHVQGADGAFAVFGLVGAGGVQQVTRADLAAMRSDLTKLEADTASVGIKDRQERIGQLRARIEAFALAMGTGEQVEMKRLSTEVRFQPQERSAAAAITRRRWYGCQRSALVARGGHGPRG